MTTAERNIADRLQSIKPTETGHKVFIDQLKNWHDRPMTKVGRNYLLKLVNRYQDQIPECEQLRSAYIDEKLREAAA